MNNTIKSFFTFSLGMAVGAAVASRYVNEKLNSKLENDINDIREYYKSREERRKIAVDLNIEDFCDIISETEGESGVDNDSVKTAAVVRYSDIISDSGYDKPVYNCSEEKSYHVVRPEDVVDSDYELVSLTLYSDNCLANDFSKDLVDIDELVGMESLSRIGEYEDGVVYVRNDDIRTDFEITTDDRRYSDIIHRQGWEE